MFTEVPELQALLRVQLLFQSYCVSGVCSFFCIKLLPPFIIPQVGSMNLLNLVDVVMLVISWKMPSALLNFERQTENGH